MTARLSIRLDFPEAVAAAASRDVVLAEAYYGDLPERARARAFTVSGLGALDQIQQVLDDMTKTVREGRTFAEWQREALTRPELAALPEGRLETIHRTAIQTHYNAGRWQQMQAAKGARPFLMYDAINDGRTRPNHRALDGYLAPADDPVWSRVAPQNGFNCRCTLISLTEAQARARGWTGSPRPLPDQPDPGWEYNPGENPDHSLDQLAARKMREAEEQQTVTHRWLNGSTATLDQLKTLGQGHLDRIAATQVEDRDGQTVSLGELLAKDGTSRSARMLSKAILQEVSAVRSVGGAKIAIQQKRGKGKEAMNAVAAVLPDDWIAAGNTETLKIIHTTSRGEYLWSSPFNPPTIKTSLSSTALHEYIHHLQFSVPGFDKPFREEHRRRTAHHPLEVVTPGMPSETGRPDGYFERYQGREYGDRPLEVVTMAMEAVLGPALEGIQNFRTNRYLVDMYRGDRAMFDLVVGMLFHFKP
jgi:SPP1 gp7 family putative phage head morphogenesis protein